MQLYAVNFIPLLVHSTCFGRHTRPSSGVQLYLQPLAPSGTSSRDNLRQPIILPVAVDTVVLLMMGVCAARNM